MFLLKANNTRINGFSISGANASGYAGISLYYTNNCIIENNKLSNNACGIYLWFANRNSILKNTATNDGDYGGILLQSSTFNTISGNNVFGNKRGVYFGTSPDNTLSSNTVQHSSGDWGLFVCPRSPRSLIYNNYINETNISIRKTLSGDPDTLNVTKTSGPNIVGGPYIGGNYWGKPDGTGFSQTAVDKNGDGFSDSAYINVSGSPYSDYLPLVTPRPASILPVANFTSNVTAGNAPLNVGFTDSSTGSPTAWNWSFGDGTVNSTVKAPTHTYSAAGNYNVSLTVTNAAGSNTVKKSNYIKVTVTTPKPVANFTSNVTSGTSPLTVLFTSKSTNAVSVSWNFGDGPAAVTGSPVSHTFANTGTSAKTFTVTLTAINQSSTSTKTGTITVNPAAPVKPVASFIVSPTSGGTTATTYTFTDASKNTPNSWSWDFGDKTAQGTANKVSHKYAKAGTYAVKLTVKNNAGNATTSKSVVVSAAPKAPVASFTYTPTAVKKGITIKFTDTSSNTPNKWKWTFSDNGATATTKTVSHVFSKTGSFKVSLTAFSNVGNNMITKTITVK